MRNISTYSFLRSLVSRFAASFYLAALLGVLGGCGGGGSSDTAGTVAGTTSTTSSTSTTTTAAASLTIALTSSAGTAVTSLTSGTPATVKATLRNAAGAVVPNAVVTFVVTDTTLATVAPSAALTDASGVATTTLSAVGLTSGATTITGTSQAGTPPAAVTGSLGFAVGASAVTISSPVVGVNPLSAFGTTSVSVTVSSGGVPVTAAQNVTFTSSCGSTGKAVLSANVATVAGVATGSFRDVGCAGTDSITATAAGVTSASTPLVVIAPTVGSIQFVAATPASISLKGTGGIEVSQVSFKVVDTGGNPLSGQVVTFGLSTTVGGITLTPTPATATSDAAGLVVTNVNSGTVSTPVRVTASQTTAGGATLTTQSNALTVTTGIPAQDSFSLSATKLNPEFREVDGLTTVLTARLADHFRNPVPDGTVVNFTTEGGSILASCQTAVGACSATMTGQAPRPTNGRVTVLAYAVGEESFIDLNGNGVADKSPNELLDTNGASTDMPEAFRDDNENGVRDASETFIDFNGNNTYDAADGSFNGVLCNNVTAPPAGSSAGTCSATKSIHVRGSLVIVFSGSTAVISQIFPVGTISAGSCLAGQGRTNTVNMRIVDAVGNPMPVGTTVAASLVGNGTLVGPTSFIQSNTNITPVAGAATHTLSIKDDSTAGPPCTDATNGGVLTITVTTPGGAVGSSAVAGVVTTATFAVNN